MQLARRTARDGADGSTEVGVSAPGTADELVRTDRPKQSIRRFTHLLQDSQMYSGCPGETPAGPSYQERAQWHWE